MYLITQLYLISEEQEISPEFLLINKSKKKYELAVISIIFSINMNLQKSWRNSVKDNNTNMLTNVLFIMSIRNE
jgi:hypothetical protein